MDTVLYTAEALVEGGRAGGRTRDYLDPVAVFNALGWPVQ